MHKLTLLVIGLLGANAASADFNVWLGADIGVSSGLINDDYKAQSLDAGIDANIDRVVDTRMNWSVALGLDINPLFNKPLLPIFLSTEFEYFDMGVVDLEYSGNITAAQNENFHARMLKIHPKSGQGGALSLITRFSPYKTINSWQLGVRLGGAYWQQEYQVFDGDNLMGTESLSGIGGLVGLQTSYKLSDYLLAKAEWKVQQFDQEYSHSSTLGFEFRPMALFPKENYKSNSPLIVSETSALQVEKMVESEPPHGESDRFSVSKNGHVTMDVLVNDGVDNGVFISRVEVGREGMVGFSDSATGQLMYQHKGGKKNQDTIRYWLMADGKESAPVTVTIDIISNPVETKEQPNAVDLALLFPTDSWSIDAQYDSELDEYALWLLRNELIHSTLVGHADGYGEKHLNFEVSQKRAQAVANFLIEKGVPSQRITVQAVGADSPIADNRSKAGRALNRRVEITHHDVTAVLDR